MRTRDHEPPLTTTYQHCGFVVVRTPLLPVDAFLACATPCAEDESTARTSLLARVRSDSTLMESIFIASPSLWQRLNSAGLDVLQRDEKLGLAIAKYFARMSTRPTPFGLFSGLTIGSVEGNGRYQLPERTHYTRKCRVDMEYVCELVGKLEQEQTLIRSLRYFPSTSLYRFGSHVRFVEHFRDRHGRRQYALSAVSCEQALEVALERAELGATREEIATLIASEVGADSTEAMEYVDELIRSRILISHLEPIVAGRPAFEALVHRLNETVAEQPYAMQLSAVLSQFEQLNSSPIGCSAHVYESIVNGLSELGQPLKAGHVFQVDMFKQGPSPVVLAKDIVDEVLECAMLFARINYKRNEALDNFVERFRARYEDAAVPFLEAVDSDIGITFGGVSDDEHPLIDGLGLQNAAHDDSRDGPRNNTEWDNYLLQQLFAALTAGHDEILLNTGDVEALARRSNGTSEMPHAMSAIVSVVSGGRASSSPAKATRLIHTKYIGATTGAELLGRFCHGSNELEALVGNLARQEQERFLDATLAEIIHLPQGRLGNILSRPQLRDREIHFLGHSSSESSRHIGLNDLLISLKGSDFCLTHRKTGERIIPRLTSAHAYQNPANLQAYRLLCNLQSSFRPSIGFDWPNSTRSAPFLPRVRFKNVLLSVARWRFTGAAVETLRSTSQIANISEAIGVWKKFKLPRIVAIRDGDNVLPIDVQNCMSLKIFAAWLRDRTSFEIEEFLLPETGHDAATFCNSEGAFASEIVIPFLASRRDQEVQPTRPSALIASTATPPKLIGSDWLYLKVYCGTGVVDEILHSVMENTLASLLKTGGIESWFFIRYADPEWHLRLRIKGNGDMLLGTVLPMIRTGLESYIRDRLVWKVVLDTYVPEVGRYGGREGLSLCEQYFQYDSEAAVRAIRLLTGQSAEPNMRWCLAALSCDRMLIDFGLDVSQRAQLASLLAAGFAREFGISKPQSVAIGSRYRQHRILLTKALCGGANTQIGTGINAVFAARSEQSSNVVRQLCNALDKARFHDVVCSLLHMSVNRFIQSSQRQHELLLYDFLRRHYESALAQQRPASTAQPAMDALV